MGPVVKPTIYDELPLPLFISGYLVILELERTAQKEAMLKHLSELVADAAIYRWEPVRVYHAVWLQQLENGHADWDDKAKKLKFRHELVWGTLCITALLTSPSPQHNLDRSLEKMLPASWPWQSLEPRA